MTVPLRAALYLRVSTARQNSKEQASNKRIFHVRTIRAALLCAQKRTSPVEQAAK
jgi:hypothetical protein